MVPLTSYLFTHLLLLTAVPDVMQEAQRKLSALGAAFSDAATSASQQKKPDSAASGKETEPRSEETLPMNLPSYVPTYLTSPSAGDGAPPLY